MGLRLGWNVTSGWGLNHDGEDGEDSGHVLLGENTMLPLRIRYFPRKHLADPPPPPPPPPNVTKLFTGLLQPTLQEGTGSFVSGGPYGPEGDPPPLEM